MDLRIFFLRFHHLVQVRVHWSYLMMLRLILSRNPFRKYAGRVYLDYDLIGPDEFLQYTICCRG